MWLPVCLLQAAVTFMAVSVLYLSSDFVPTEWHKALGVAVTAGVPQS